MASRDIQPKELLADTDYVPVTREPWRKRREEVVRLARQSVDTGVIARRMRVSERRVRQILAEEAGGNEFRKKSSAERA